VIACAQADLADAYAELIDETAEVEVEAGRWVEGAADAAKAAVEAAVAEYTDLDTILDMIDDAKVGDTFWAEVVRPAVQAANAQ
jgi:hypothetical protein